MGRVDMQGKHSQHDLLQICWHRGRPFPSVVKPDLLGPPCSLFPQGQGSVEVSKKLSLVEL